VVISGIELNVNGSRGLWRATFRLTRQARAAMACGAARQEVSHPHAKTMGCLRIPQVRSQIFLPDDGSRETPDETDRSTSRRDYGCSDKNNPTLMMEN